MRKEKLTTREEFENYIKLNGHDDDQKPYVYTGYDNNIDFTSKFSILNGNYYTEKLYLNKLYDWYIEYYTDPTNDIDEDDIPSFEDFIGRDNNTFYHFIEFDIIEHQAGLDSLYWEHMENGDTTCEPPYLYDYDEVCEMVITEGILYTAQDEKDNILRCKTNLTSEDVFLDDDSSYDDEDPYAYISSYMIDFSDKDDIVDSTYITEALYMKRQYARYLDRMSTDKDCDESFEHYMRYDCKEIPKCHFVEDDIEEQNRWDYVDWKCNRKGCDGYSEDCPHLCYSYDKVKKMMWRAETTILTATEDEDYE